MFASIKDILENPILNSNVTINGWIRTKRSNGKIGFIEINDGSTLKGNNTNQKTANNGNYTTNHYVKVYPSYNNDNFEAIKNINKFPVKAEKTHALIGPILKDNLGIIIKILKTKGYSLIEYIEDNN